MWLQELSTWPEVQASRDCLFWTPNQLLTKQRQIIDVVSQFRNLKSLFKWITGTTVMNVISTKIREIFDSGRLIRRRNSRKNIFRRNWKNVFILHLSQPCLRSHSENFSLNRQPEDTGPLISSITKKFISQNVEGRHLVPQPTTLSSLVESFRPGRRKV